MPIQFACLNCGKSFSVKDELAGKKGKCSACGTPMQVPILATQYSIPEYSPPARPAEAPRVGAPIASPAPAAAPTTVVNVAVGVAMPPERKRAGGVGIASFVLGLVALLLCWIPLLNLVALPLILIGGLLAVAGIALSLIGRRSGIAWPAIGGVLNAVAFAGFLVVTSATADVARKVADDLKRDRAGSGPIARPAKKEVLAAEKPKPGPPKPEAKAPEPEPTVPLGDSAILGDLDVFVVKVVKCKTPLVRTIRDPDDDGRGDSKDVHLSIHILVENTSPTRKIDYRTMGSTG